jgi:hypothetical protein
MWRNHTQHNDTQHKELISDTQHKRHNLGLLCHYAECHVLFFIMLNVTLLSVDMLKIVT